MVQDSCSQCRLGNRLGALQGLLQRQFSLCVLPAGLIQATRSPKNPDRQERVVRIGYEDLSLLKPKRRCLITAKRLIGLGQTNQRVDLVPTRSELLVDRLCLCPALDRLLEIATLIRLAAVLHQLIDWKRLLRRDVRSKSHRKTQGNAHENRAYHDRLLVTRETGPRLALLACPASY